MLVEATPSHEPAWAPGMASATVGADPVTELVLISFVSGAADDQGVHACKEREELFSVCVAKLV